MGIRSGAGQPEEEPGHLSPSATTYGTETAKKCIEDVNKIYSTYDRYGYQVGIVPVESHGTPTEIASVVVFVLMPVAAVVPVSLAGAYWHCYYCTTSATF